MTDSDLRATGSAGGPRNGAGGMAATAAALAAAAILALAASGCGRGADGEATAATSVAPDTTDPVETASVRPTPTLRVEPTPRMEPTPRVEPTEVPTASPSPEPDGRDPTPRAEPTETPRAEAAATPTRTPVEIESSPAQTPTAAPDAVYGGVLRLTTQADIAHQDVHAEVSPALSTWGPGIAYSRLMRFRTGPDVALPSLEVICDLCESWRALDPVTFEFTLRDGVRWHDEALTGGRDLTSQDVLYSLSRQGRGPNGVLLGSIEEISAPAPRTLLVRLVEPDADFMLGLADARSKIVAPEAVALTGSLREGPTVGTGPWRLVSTGRFDIHSFERFDGYFDGGLPYADGLQVHVVPDLETRDAAFLVEQIDVIEVTPLEWETLREELRERAADVVTITTPVPGSGVEIALNAERPPFDDPAVRRAAFAAMDSAGALEEIWRGAGYLSFGFPLSGPSWALDRSELAGRLDSPSDARRLLGGARPAPVTLRVGLFGDEYLRHAERVAREMRAVGFEVEVEEVTRVAFADDVWRGGDYQAFLGPIPPVTSPNAFLFSAVHSAGPYYRGGPATDGLDGLIEAQAGEYDPAVRSSMHREIQRLMLDAAVRYMPVTHVTMWAAQPWVGNLHLNLAGFEYAHWASVWVGEGRR